MPDNPYKHSETTHDEDSIDEYTAANAELELSIGLIPAVSPGGTAMPRMIGAMVDSVLSLVLCVVMVKLLPIDEQIVQAVIALKIYLVYFIVFETVYGATPGKLLTGLRVLSFDGSKC